MQYSNNCLDSVTEIYEFHENTEDSMRTFKLQGIIENFMLLRFE